jgi:hypothetical protein
LREHTDIATEYVALKRRLAALTDAADASSREAYAGAKMKFIEHVVQTALAAGYPRDSLTVTGDYALPAARHKSSHPQR